MNDVVSSGLASKMHWGGNVGQYWILNENSSVKCTLVPADCVRDGASAVAAPTTIELIDRLPVTINSINRELLGTQAHLKIIKDDDGYYAGYYDISHKQVASIIRHDKTLVDALAQVYITLKFGERMKGLE